MLRTFIHDLSASGLAALAAIPASLAIATGVGIDPASGIISILVGSLIVVFFTSSKFEVTGPASSLVLLSAGVYYQYGAAGLAMTVALAGGMQLLLAVSGLSRWFQILPPAVILGVSAAIGLMTIAHQVQLLGGSNLNSNSLTALTLALCTVVILWLWPKLKFKHLQRLPASVVALLILCPITFIFALSTGTPGHLLGSFYLPITTADPLNLWALFNSEIFISALCICFVSTSKTIVVANVLASKEGKFVAGYAKELAGLGIGNVVSGLLGGMPITAIMDRSLAMYSAEAKSRGSIAMQSLWVVGVIVVFPSLLEVIPLPIFSGILIFAGIKLMDTKAWQFVKKKMYGEGLIFFGTLITSVFFQLSVGVLVGIVLAVLKLALTFAADFDVQVQPSSDAEPIKIKLKGALNFLSLPTLNRVFTAFSGNSVIDIDTSEVYYIDHGVMAYLYDLQKRFSISGGELNFSFEELVRRMDAPINSRTKLIQELKALDRRKTMREDVGRRTMDSYLTNNEKKPAEPIPLKRAE